jgi:hypothetical protein
VRNCNGAAGGHQPPPRRCLRLHGHAGASRHCTTAQAKRMGHSSLRPPPHTCEEERGGVGARTCGRGSGLGGGGGAAQRAGGGGGGHWSVPGRPRRQVAVASHARRSGLYTATARWPRRRREGEEARRRWRSARGQARRAARASSMDGGPLGRGGCE